MNTMTEQFFAKTKILATLGPATSSTGMIKAMMRVGVDGVRLNFSHGDYSFFEEVFHNINTACVEEKQPLATLLDLQGPKIRIGKLAEDFFEIVPGDELEITIEDIPGTKQKVSTSYKLLAQDAQINDIILIDDGLLRLQIKRKTDTSVICDILNGGILKPKKGMNLPGMKLSTPSITAKDFADLEFAMQFRVDFIALSFVRQAEDIILLKDWLSKKGKTIPIIAKIEKKEAVENLEEILQVADGIMVARGDLGVELEPQEVPLIQKKIIHRCNEVGKTVITATQMLESMISNPVPTRAEASDVANAVWDGTDVVMLSGETSVGKFPVKTVEIMNKIILNAEQHIPHKHINYLVPENVKENLFDSMNKGIVSMSRQINADAIVGFTSNGKTPRGLSKYRPACKIIALSDNFNTMNALCLSWGVTSLYCEEIDQKEVAIFLARKLILENKLAKPGDTIIFTAGGAKAEKIRENWIRFEEV